MSFVVIRDVVEIVIEILAILHVIGFKVNSVYLLVCPQREHWKIDQCK